ncbi:hypothetical protein CVN56_26075 [Rhodococcus sp. AQ5-07]|nr:hypothetical protein CVN56_26075 [Rhodococcus sp. AQ5-07]
MLAKGRDGLCRVDHMSEASIAAAVSLINAGVAWRDLGTADATSAKPGVLLPGYGTSGSSRAARITCIADSGWTALPAQNAHGPPLESWLSRGLISNPHFVHVHRHGIPAPG